MRFSCTACPPTAAREISSDMLEHRSSVVWDEAENRLHAQKALLEALILGFDRLA